MTAMSMVMMMRGWWEEEEEEEEADGWTLRNGGRGPSRDRAWFARHARGARRAARERVRRPAGRRGTPGLGWTL